MDKIYMILRKFLCAPFIIYIYDMILGKNSLYFLPINIITILLVGLFGMTGLILLIIIMLLV